MNRKTLSLFGVYALVAGLLACSSAKPATPVAPSAPDAKAAPDGSTLKASAPGPQSPINGQKLTSEVVVLTISPATMTFATDAALQYRYQVLTTAGTIVDEAQVPSTARQVGATLLPNTVYNWRARAEAADAGGQTQAGPWSTTASFLTRDPAIVDDPLTNGRTVGRQIGGQFVAGGWQSRSVTDGIDYDIATCNDCTVEFDITNIGKGEGRCCNADLKFLTMGDANAFADFSSFRDHRWKMHLIQRGDGDGTGLEIIWRNGGTSPNGNPGDHRIKMLGGGPDFRGSSVFHFVVRWTPFGYNISVGTDGGPQIEYLSDGFGGFPYAPPNHRISLGCYPRSESFIGAIYRNVRVIKNQ